MTRPQFGSVQVHRFGEDVALYAGLKPNPSWGRNKREGSTLYITAREAGELAAALLNAAQEIQNGVAFTESRVGTYSANVTGDRTFL